MQPLIPHRAKLVLSIIVVASGLTVVLGEYFLSAGYFRFSLIARTVFWVAVIGYFSLRLADRSRTRE